MILRASSLAPRARFCRGGWIAAGLGLALVTGGAVQAVWDRGWSGPGDGRLERGARLQRLCANDTARHHPVFRAFVRSDLRLSEMQAADFERHADLILPGLEEVKREVCNDVLERRGTAPERLTHSPQVLRTTADTAGRAVEPSQRFHASLDERQKERVDELTGRRRLPRP